MYYEAMTPVIIDCDPGIDDVMALLIALASENLDIRGITTLAGNVAAASTARNAQAICELTGRNIEVCAGAEEPLDKRVSTASEIHGSNGIGDVELPVRGSIGPLHSVEFLKQKLDQSDGSLEIVALGPLTNLALLLKQYPESFQRIRRISLMGGSLGRGNVTAHAEFNFFADPLAADRVLRSGVPVDVYGLDVTNQALLFANQIDELGQTGGRVLEPAVRIIRHYLKFYESKGLKGIKLHDPLAVAALINPELCEMRSFALKVETGDGETRGQMMEAGTGPRNCRVAVNHNQDAFIGLFMSLMTFWNEGE